MTSFSPIFAVGDLDRALDHYRSLGFRVRPWSGGGYGFADRGKVSLHLTEQSDYDPHVHSRSAYLYVKDADALFAEWSRSGIGGVTRPVSNTEWGMREGSHVDLDGNVVRFGAPIDE